MVNGASMGVPPHGRDIPKFRKVQPYANPRLGPCGVRDAPGTPNNGGTRKPVANAFIHQLKEPDEGWHSRIM